MKRSIIRALILILLAGAITLAITRPPQSYYPQVSVEAGESAGGALKLDFIFDGKPTLGECEALTGNIARILLKACPQCKIQVVTCDPVLSPSLHELLSETPIPTPSGRMANGVIIFEATNPELALASCQAAQAQALKTANPVSCHAADTPRPRSAGPSPLTFWSPALVLIAFMTSWLVGWLIIRYEHLHAHFSHDPVDSGPQKAHSEPTPRIGGITILSGLLAAGAVMLMVDQIPAERAFGLLLLSSIPAFLGGLVEDITKKVGVLERLFLTILSGAVAAWLLGAILNRLDLPGVDQALTWLPLAVVLTAFAVGGLANAMNIIDGTNGLAIGFSIIVLTAMAYVANLVGDTLVFPTALAVIGALLGLLVWNWPGGKIFIGDGGAYLLGFLLAELSVLLVVRNPGVSPWFPLLLMIYPIFETLYSVYRRKIQHQLSPGQPDNQHLHQLIRDRLVARCGRDGNQLSKLERSSRTAMHFWAYGTVLAVLSGVFWKSTPILGVCSFGFCVFYVANYRRIAAMEPPKEDSGR